MEWKFTVDGSIASIKILQHLVDNSEAFLSCGLAGLGFYTDCVRLAPLLPVES